MGYSTGLLDKRARILRAEPHTDERGRRIEYRAGEKIWCGLTFTRGARAMHAGELFAYDVALFRSRYVAGIDNGTRIVCDGKYYSLTSVQSDYRRNTVQAVATEIKPFDYD
ncbi:MAG: head-tail adaptor protein [Alloprevotella sp.]